MALTVIDIVQINKALSQSIDTIDINDFYTFSKKSTASLEDVLYQLIKMLISLFEKKDTNYKKMNKLLYSIKIFTEECFKVDQTVDPEFFVKLKAVSDAFDAFEGPKDEIQERMDDFLELMNKNNPFDDNEDLKLLQQLKNDKDELQKKVAELESIIESLNKKISHLTKLAEKNKKEAEKNKVKNIKNDNSYIELQNNNKELLSQIELLNQEIVSLRKEVNKLNGQISELEKKLKEKEHYYEEIIKKLKKEIEQKNKEVNDLKRSIEESEIQREEELKIVTREEFICEVIMNALLSSKHKTSDLKKILLSLNIELTDSELNYYLNLVRSRLNIKTSFRNGTAFYEINTAMNTKESLSIDNNKSSEISFLVLSNMFLSTFTTSERKDIEALYNYCIDKKINYIINLGNIFDFTLSKTPTVSDIKRFEEILNKVLATYPTDSSIYNFLLGGLVEESILSLGLNPVNILAASRGDFIDLGYVNTSLLLGKSTILLHRSEYDNSSIVLPHPNSLNSPYINLIAGDNTDINLALNSATIPAFSSDSLVRAFHMKVCFDPNSKIDCINFMPLIIDKKVMHTSNILYTKYKAKKE